MKFIIYTLFIVIPFFDASINAQNVGIGTSSPVAKLDVNSPTSNFTARFNGDNQMYIGLFESNTLRGYLGSFSGATEDFDIGTSTGNTNGKLHLTTKAIPKMTIDADGNVGIGTTSPSASSLLDLNSTSKGILIPRMTSAQRTAIVSPTNGLMVYDNTTNSFWYFDGSAWTNMSGESSLTLPYSSNVNIVSDVFHIENSGNGNVLSIGNLGSGQGLSAYTLSGHAISANSSSGYGVRASSFSNYPLLALSDNAANTLASIRAINIGGGDGIFGSASASNKVGVRGEATGASGIGVIGTANSATGVGVAGISSTHHAVSGSSNSGTALFGQSTTGYALETSGKVKISGGNTNPTLGAVLTSDASGNAVWKNNRIAFGAIENAISSQIIDDAVATKIEFDVEQFDLQSNFVHTSGSPSSNTSVFTAPLSGIYNLNTQVTLLIFNGTFGSSHIYMKLLRAGTESTILISSSEPSNGTDLSQVAQSINTEVHLMAGDKIWVEVVHYSNNNHASVGNGYGSSWFRGSLLFAD